MVTSRRTSVRPATVRRPRGAIATENIVAILRERARMWRLFLSPSRFLDGKNLRVHGIAFFMKFQSYKLTVALMLCLAGLFLVQGFPARAADEGEERAVAEVTSIAPGRPIWIAVYIDPEPGSYVSWVDLETGDKGLGVNLTLPPGFRKGELVRPAPMPVEGNIVFGNGEAFWALQEILVDRSVAPQDAFTITGNAFWYECAEIECYDARRAFSLNLPFGLGEANPGAGDIFAWARAEAPPWLPWPLHYRADATTIEIEIFMDKASARAVDSIYILPVRGMKQGNLRSHLDLSRSADGIFLQAIPSEDFMPGMKLDALLFISSKEGGTTVYRAEAVNLLQEDLGFSLDSPGFKNMTLWLALGLAFLGGILLNLMPCVFPVLALKVFGVVKAGAVSPRRLKADALAYTAGILLSFIIVALVLLTVRSMGQQVGWGFQLQSPYFITVLALVLFLVALSFAGLFHIRLPFALAFKPGADGMLGSFYTGMLATVVATPCTAPFMAPALGFALGLPTLEAVLIFLGLGLGLAAPYLLIGFIPGASALFPKPGPWMETFKKVLVIPIAATIGWLLWVLWSQVGAGGAWVPLVYMGLAAAFLVILRESKKWPGRARPLALGVYLLSGIALVQLTITPLGTTIQRPVAGEAVKFSEGVLWNLRLQGKGVFVNYTATWCLTCLVNEKLVFSKAKFQQFLADNNIVYMEADWTNPDDEIAGSLEALGRTALPVYAFYPPGGPTYDPVLLPEILTMETALEILSSKLP